MSGSRATRRKFPLLFVLPLLPKTFRTPSFAGQQETYLNVVGLEQVFARMKEVFASLYNDRAISYRVHKGFNHADVALSARCPENGSLR